MTAVSESRYLEISVSVLLQRHAPASDVAGRRRFCVHRRRRTHTQIAQHLPVARMMASRDEPLRSAVSASELAVSTAVDMECWPLHSGLPYPPGLLQSSGAGRTPCWCPIADCQKWGECGAHHQSSHSQSLVVVAARPAVGQKGSRATKPYDHTCIHGAELVLLVVLLLPCRGQIAVSRHWTSRHSPHSRDLQRRIPLLRCVAQEGRQPPPRTEQHCWPDGLPDPLSRMCAAG